MTSGVVPASSRTASIAAWMAARSVRRAGRAVHEEHLGVVRDLGQRLDARRDRLQPVVERAHPEVVEDRADAAHPHLVRVVELARLHGDELLRHVLGVVLVGEVEDRSSGRGVVAGDLEREGRLAEALGAGEQDQRPCAHAAADEGVETPEAGLPDAAGRVAAGEHAFVAAGQRGPDGRELLIHVHHRTSDVAPVGGESGVCHRFATICAVPARARTVPLETRDRRLSRAPRP